MRVEAKTQSIEELIHELTNKQITVQNAIKDKCTKLDILEKVIELQKLWLEWLETDKQQLDDLVVEFKSKDFENEQQQMIFEDKMSILRQQSEDMKQKFQSEIEMLRQRYIDEPVVNASFDSTIEHTNQLSPNEQIGDQFGEDMCSDGQTTVKITSDLLAEDLQNRGDMCCPTISEEDVVTNTDVSTDKPNTEQVIDKEEHKQMGDNIIESFDEQIRDMDIEQSSERVIGEQQLSQNIDVECVAIDESSQQKQSSEQKSPSDDSVD